MSTIRFTGVGHQYGGGTVLEDINLTLAEQRIGIIGANGSGKSTLARMINGLVLPTRGTVTVDTLDPARHGREVRRRVGFMFTDPDSQIVMPTVAEDVAFTLRRRGLSKEETTEKVDAILSRFGLAAHADHPSHLLSGGQKQLLALAAILVGGPSILVADEPTTLLDAFNLRRVGRIFAAMDQQLVIVTHHLELLRDFDRVILIHQGKVAADGAPAPVLAAYQKLWETLDEAPLPAALSGAGPR
ncbi:ABC transporter ATP-binding protein [Arthrobacter sp. SDTb3-6]|uniref:energy-coupling factor ABC transporter ATP-binding protein n=1 Tax=Arthrobacter sp. SDTb3-6 TaxID=2713571 RepID=UPI00159D15E5|nr:ABC transporter ATP-binding protein [Arthrobacter sp. SDTb3-6]